MYSNCSSMLTYSPQNGAKSTLPKVVCGAYLPTYKLSIEAPARRLNLCSLKPVRVLTQIKVIFYLEIGGCEVQSIQYVKRC
jgi:hypothetical protein